MSNHYRVLFALLAGFLLTGAGCVSFSKDKSGTTGPSGMFVSTDKGESWKSISVMPTASGVKSLAGVDVYGVVEDPQDPNAMYWLTRTQGLMYSYDNGQSWRQSGEPFNTGFVYSVVIHPKNRCTLFATNGRQVFRSEDCLRSWTEVYREGDVSRYVRNVAYNPFSPHEIYLAENTGDFIKSQDSGLSWQTAGGPGVELTRLFFDPLEEGAIYVATQKSGLYRSLDKGATWKQLKEDLESFSGALEYRRMSLYPARPGYIHWVSKYGLLVSRNRGDDWEPFSLITPPGSVNIFAVGVNPKNDKEMYYTATVNNRSTFYRSIDGGKNWVTRKLPSGQIPTFLRVHPGNGWVYLGFSIPPKQK